MPSHSSPNSSGDLSHLSDEELVLLSIANAENYVHLMQRYEVRLLRYIQRITAVSSDDAEDFLQEAYIKAYRYLHSYDHHLSYSSWMYRICRNTVIDAARKRDVRPKTVPLEYTHDGERISLPLPDPSNLEEELDHTLSDEYLERLFASLDVKYRDVLVLRYLEDMSLADIADVLQKPKNTVSTLLHRARKLLAEHYAPPQP